MSSNTTSPKASTTVSNTPRLSTSSTLSPPAYTQASDFYTSPSSNASKRSLTSLFHRKSSDAASKKEQKEKKEKRNYRMESEEKEAVQAARAFYFATR